MAKTFNGSLGFKGGEETNKEEASLGKFGEEGRHLTTSLPSSRGGRVEVSVKVEGKEGKKVGEDGPECRAENLGMKPL